MLLACACGGIGELLILAVIGLSILVSYFCERMGWNLKIRKPCCKCDCHEHSQETTPIGAVE